MEMFDVYPKLDLQLASAQGSTLISTAGETLIDLYGGHGVISIGHSHPTYVSALKDQIEKIGFYSNAIHVQQQIALAEKLGELSGSNDYQLFLCNSGAEANENAIKLASFATGRSKMIAFKGSFHGRTSSALSVTDNPALSAPINQGSIEVDFLQLEDFERVSAALRTEDVAAIIIEGIQGVGGLDAPSSSFLQHLYAECKKFGTKLILDEIQSGYGRSGKFFAHQYAGVSPDLITIAKGMGNGFPIAGVLIAPNIEATHGMLGTTFGGNHLACAAGIAVLDVIKEEQLIQKAGEIGDKIKRALNEVSAIKQIKGEGLMIGIELYEEAGVLRQTLFNKYNMVTGSSANKNLVRILPPLNISEAHIDQFIDAIKTELS